VKFLRLGPRGSESPALLATDGSYRDLTGVVRDVDGGIFAADAMARLRSVDPMRLPLIDHKTRIGPCVGNVGKLIGVGLNYADHAAEGNMPLPKEPILFMKATSSIIGPDDDVVLPRGATQPDWEVELGIIIGREARYIDEADALNHVGGYCVVNDVSERAFQHERGGQWTKGKSADTFGPIGPWVVTADEIPDPQKLRLWLEVDGHRYQNGTTSQMIFGVRKLVSYISQFMSLRPGDIISTGTPAGVGAGQKPSPVWLRAGQVMRLSVEGLGEQSQRVRAFEP